MKKGIVLRVAMGVLSVAAWLAVGSEAKASNVLCEGTWEVDPHTQSETIAGQKVPTGGYMACRTGDEGNRVWTCSIEWSLEPPYGVQQTCFDSPLTVSQRLRTCKTVYETSDPNNNPPTWVKWTCHDNRGKYICNLYVSPPDTVLTDCI